MKSLLSICLVLLLSFPGLSQDYSLSRRFWSLTGINGAIQAGGDYRYQAGYSNDIYNYQKSSRLYGGLLLNTTSYFLHPNFLILNLGGEYNPVKGRICTLSYLIRPN